MKREGDERAGLPGVFGMSFMEEERQLEMMEGEVYLLDPDDFTTPDEAAEAIFGSGGEEDEQLGIDDLFMTAADRRAERERTEDEWTSYALTRADQGE